MVHTLQVQSSHTSKSLWKSLKLVAQILICVPKTGEEEVDNLILFPCTARAHTCACMHTSTFAIYIHKRNKIGIHSSVLAGLLFKIFILFFIHMCAFVWVCVQVPTESHGGQMRTSESLKLE